jgi:hypothetical protein
MAFRQPGRPRQGIRSSAIGAEDGDRVLSAIDTLYARYAQGFVICTPDPNLGTAIRLRAQANRLKVLAVDDRLLGPDGRAIAAIPISASRPRPSASWRAGSRSRRRGGAAGRWARWACCASPLTASIPDASGARALSGRSLPGRGVCPCLQRAATNRGYRGGFTAADPVLTQSHAIRRWIILGINDESVLGGVRAAEGLGLGADAVIGVGIGGSGVAVAEFARRAPTGFHASVLLSPAAMAMRPRR